MHTENRITIRGDIDHIFAVASAVEAWPRLLPHYRWVTVLRRTVPPNGWWRWRRIGTAFPCAGPPGSA